MVKAPGLSNSCRVLAAGWVTILLLALPMAAHAGEAGFTRWLAAFRQDARRQGISAAVLAGTLDKVRYLPQVIRLDHRQPERLISFRRYQARIVTPARIARGRLLYARYHRVLRSVGRRYGVSPRIIVALWGIETDFGVNTGGFLVVDALATLAYDGRRGDYFRTELLDALRIIDRHHFTRMQLRGSWAGAMGQSQFMPSSYLKYAVAYSGTGRADIWTNPADVLASTAHYLTAIGWTGGETWGRPVRLPPGFNRHAAGSDRRRSLDEWRRVGIEEPDGRSLPGGRRTASLVLPDGRGGAAFLVYGNYQALLNWNHSTYFAITVGLLADRIGGKAVLP